MSKDFYRITCKANTARMDIYDEIGFWGMSAKKFADDWKRLEDSKAKSIDVHIASPGGDMFAGLTIYNVIQQSEKPVDIYIDGLAASAASLIAMAGRKTHMAENGLLMLHNPSTFTYGDENDHEKSLVALRAGKEALIVAYERKSGKTRDAIDAILTNETWYGADEAKAEGFVDEVIEAVPLAARFDMSNYGYEVPAKFAEHMKPAEIQPVKTANAKEPKKMANSETPEIKPALLPELKAACVGADATFLMAQMEANATVPQAQTAWVAKLNADLAAEKQRATDAEAARVAAEKKSLENATPPGNAPLGAGDAPKVENSGDAIAQWDELVAANIAKGMNRQKAVSAACKKEPALHAAYIEAYNKERRRA